MSPDPKDMSYISEPEPVGNNIVITPVSPDPLDRAVEAGVRGVRKYNHIPGYNLAGLVMYQHSEVGTTSDTISVDGLVRAVLQAALTEGAIVTAERFKAATDLYIDQLRTSERFQNHATAVEQERDAALAEAEQAEDVLLGLITALDAEGSTGFTSGFGRRIAGAIGDAIGELDYARYEDAHKRAAAHVVSVEDPE